MKQNPQSTIHSPFPLILVAGATASGKSQLAQELALEKNGEIINADSQQFYQGLDIGTGKFLPEERKVRHWLLDIIRPGQFMTAMEFARQADEVIAELFQQEKVPILVGGTGLYIRALLEGLDNLPPRNSEIRERLQKEFETRGGDVLHQRLSKVDPISAQKISPQDSSRLVRYLEIYEQSGQAPSNLMRKQPCEKLRYSVHTYWLQPERAILRERIQKRVQSMLEVGWLQEIRALMDQGQDPKTWPNQPIGYGELADVLLGKTTLEAAQKTIVKKTQAYAKRQQTFFQKLFKNLAYRSHGSSLFSSGFSLTPKSS